MLRQICLCVNICGIKGFYYCSLLCIFSHATCVHKIQSLFLIKHNAIIVILILELFVIMLAAKESRQRIPLINFVLYLMIRFCNILGNMSCL